jgi:ribosomal protein S4
MIYPGYLLNPGDMFQVDPDRVMYATGAPKRMRSSEHMFKIAKAEREVYGGKATKEPAEDAEAPKEEADGSTALAEEGESATAEAPKSETAKPEAIAPAVPSEPGDPEEEKKQTVSSLQKLMSKARDILKRSKADLSVKQKQSIRTFIKDTREVMKKANRPTPTDDPVKAVEELSGLLSELAVSTSNELKSQPEPEPQSRKDPPRGLNPQEKAALEQLLQEAAENPIDPTKPYKTPWRPRNFMSAFVFIPRYLEVNQNICAAVYLRHPVARQARAEVPTPYPPEVGQLTHNWYLRRR